MSLAPRAAASSALRRSTHTLQATDGAQLFLCRHEPRAARARVMLVHGYSEHSGRYERIIELLVDRGLSVAAGDLRGHGLSHGRRGHITRFEHYLDDLQTMLAHLREQNGDALPLFLLGHSLGGLIAACHVQARPHSVDGLVLVAPFVGLKFTVPPWKQSLARVVSGLWPTFHLPSGVPPELLSRDPEYFNRLQADPLAFKHATARWFTETVAAQRRTLGAPGAVGVPLLLMLAGADAIVCNDAARALHTAMAAPAGTAQVYEYPDCYHDLLHEPEHARIVDDLTAWIDAQLDAQAPAQAQPRSPSASGVR
jgi:lysophospholipase